MNPCGPWTSPAGFEPATFGLGMPCRVSDDRRITFKPHKTLGPRKSALTTAHPFWTKTGYTFDTCTHIGRSSFYSSVAK